VPNYDIAPDVGAAVRDFRLPRTLGFGLVNAPVMFSVDFKDGEWGRGVLTAYGPISILPGARALQYAELAFEGLKAYRVGQPQPNLFRPIRNCLRLQRSAERLSMPTVPEVLFLLALEAVTSACSGHIPGHSGHSLYLRPFLYGTESGYLVKNSKEFRFMVIAHPVEAYSSGPMRVVIERTDIRAAVGGLGAIKAAANYAGSLRATSAAIARGYTVALWLDAREHKYIQELSGMNIFVVIEGELHTPELDGAILPGITRDSIICLARYLGFVVRERAISVEELLVGVLSGECSEIFACGTGAIITPIAVLADADGREYVPRTCDSVAKQLRESLLAIQERRATDHFGWTRLVDLDATRWDSQ